MHALCAILTMQPKGSKESTDSATSSLYIHNYVFPLLSGWSLNTTHLKLTKASDLDLEKEIERDLNICNVMYMDDNTTSQYYQTLSHSIDLLQEFIPRNFSTEFMNPCWYNFQQIPSNLLNHTHPCSFPVSIDPSQEKHALQQVKNSSEQHLHCLPAFFLSGFFKCATTTLYTMISQHPLVALSKCKECGFWSTFVSEERTYLHKRIQVLWYLSIFSQSIQTIESNRLSITLDATIAYNQYLSNDYCVLPVLLKRVLPKAKFILIMRNPTQRYFSHYWFITVRQIFTNETDFLLYGHTKRALEIFHSDTVHAIQQFQLCVDSENSIVYCVINEKVSILSGLQHGLYYYHIVPWLNIIPRERFLFLRTEDLARDPSLTMSKVWYFLNLDNWNNPESVFLNKGPLYEDIVFPPPTKKLINEFYQPYNELLAHLLSDTRYLWDD